METQEWHEPNHPAWPTFVSFSSESITGQAHVGVYWKFYRAGWEDCCMAFIQSVERLPMFGTEETT